MKTNLHHRHPRSLGGGNTPKENVVEVPEHLHNAWNLIFTSYRKEAEKWLPDDVEYICKKLNAIHLLFGIKDPKMVCEAINTFWGDYRYEFMYLLSDNGPEFCVVRKPSQVN